MEFIILFFVILGGICAGIAYVNHRRKKALPTSTISVGDEMIIEDLVDEFVNELALTGEDIDIDDLGPMENAFHDATPVQEEDDLDKLADQMPVVNSAPEPDYTPTYERTPNFYSGGDSGGSDSGGSSDSGGGGSDE